jgi:hypothetical protein
MEPVLRKRFVRRNKETRRRESHVIPEKAMGPGLTV